MRGLVSIRDLAAQLDVAPDRIRLTIAGHGLRTAGRWRRKHLVTARVAEQIRVIYRSAEAPTVELRRKPDGWTVADLVDMQRLT